MAVRLYRCRLLNRTHRRRAGKGRGACERRKGSGGWESDYGRSRNSGQMTVELCIVIPVVIIIAAIAFNAITFFGYCAEFDRLFRNETRVLVVASPSGVDAASAVSQIDSDSWFNGAGGNPRAEISIESETGNVSTIKGELSYRPTLFGLETRQEVFGVPMPELKHSTQLTIETDKEL